MKGHRAVIVVQALDRQWEVILPASPPLTPFGDGRLIRPTAEAAFNDSEARAKPVVAALETNLKGQRDAAWQHMLPAPKKGIDVENSDWDHFWFGTPAQPVIFHEWTNSIETRQREVIKQYQDRGVYDLYGRPFDYLNKR